MKAKSPLLSLALISLLITLFTALAPLEKTLGANARTIYLHGAWVWAALLLFLSAAMAGLIGLLTRRQALHRWSRALGRTGLLFWLLFLPMSLYIMQANWNGLFLDEPRFRIPLNFAVVGLLLQVGLSFFPNPQWTSIGNLAFGAALVAGMSSIQSVLHPVSPIFNTNARDIQLFFAGIFLLLLLAAWFFARLLWMSDSGWTRKEAASTLSTRMKSE